MNGAASRDEAASLARPKIAFSGQEHLLRNGFAPAISGEESIGAKPKGGGGRWALPAESRR